jgi:hypothetical protein
LDAPALPLTTFETVIGDTPASAATWAMVTRSLGVLIALSTSGSSAL